MIAYEDDCVTRLIQDDVNDMGHNQIKNWSISELREVRARAMKLAWTTSPLPAKG
ncbi:ethanolamine ammonia-lyase subunit EutB [Shigella boydii]